MKYIAFIVVLFFMTFSMPEKQTHTYLLKFKGKATLEQVAATLRSVDNFRQEYEFVELKEHSWRTYTYFIVVKGDKDKILAKLKESDCVDGVEIDDK